MPLALRAVSAKQERNTDTAVLLPSTALQPFWAGCMVNKAVVQTAVSKGFISCTASQ